MASNLQPSILLPITFLAMLHCTNSQGPAAAPRPALDCADALLNLSSCLTYVEAGSNLTRPEKGCCRSLAGVVDAEPICLCQLIGGSDSYGVKTDTTKALMLPTICRVDAPPASLCAVLGNPVASPSPTSGGPEEPESSPSALPGTLATTSPGGSSCGTTYTATGLAVLIAASYAGTALLIF